METRATYGATAKIRPECLRPFADGWEQPTAEEVRAVIQTAGLTGSQASKLLGIADGRTVRRWSGGESPIPFSAWAILCQVAGYGIIWKVPPKPAYNAGEPRKSPGEAGIVKGRGATTEPSCKLGACGARSAHNVAAPVGASDNGNPRMQHWPVARCWLVDCGGAPTGQPPQALARTWGDWPFSA